MTNFILTNDNRLLQKNGSKTTEVMGYVTEFYLDKLIDNLKEIKKKYLIDTIGRSAWVRLTKKQWQVVQLWQEGLSSSEIAAQLGVSRQVVANLKKRVAQKVNLLRKDQNFRLKTESEYRKLWSHSQLYKVQFIQHKSISEIVNDDYEYEQDRDLENIFFSDDGQDARNFQGALMRDEILSALNSDERQLAQWLESSYTPKECHEMMISRGRKIALISVYKMIYRMREKLKDYKND